MTKFWTPDPDRAANSQMAEFMKFCTERTGLTFPDYQSLWQWSVDDPEPFWMAIWDFCDIQSPTPPALALADPSMPGAKWFPGTQVNYTGQIMRHAGRDRVAIRHQAEDGTMTDLSWTGLKAQVEAMAHALDQMGIGPGDRVVGYLPNNPDTIIAFLACASIGATWSLCAPDMGAPTVLERFRQIEPKAIFTVSGYVFSGKHYDRSAEVQALLDGLPTVDHWICMDAAHSIARDGLTRYDFAKLTAGEDRLPPRDLPFDHPLWVVYSSGTTGAPKAIVHGHGGVIVEHLKTQILHQDTRPEDTFCWYTSTGWIMWNMQVSGLLTGATVALAEGNPNYPDTGRLWRFIEEAGVTTFGVGAAYVLGCMKAGVILRDLADLSRLNKIGTTGSPLPPEAYEWIWANTRPNMWIDPIAGGTDFASGFLVGAPNVPVEVGVMPCRALGANVQAFDEAGNSLINEVGELVCSTPLPSMPLRFWNDPGDARLISSYFDTYPGVWRHGDWVRITPEGGGIIYGRSDATINRHGIRMGTAEIYSAVEDQPEVADSLVVDLEYLGRESCMILFVKLIGDAVLSDALKDRIVASLRKNVSPRHVPDRIEAAPDVPYTLTGKKLEVPIKKRLLGHRMDAVLTADAMANPGCLEWYDAYATAYLNEST